MELPWLQSCSLAAKQLAHYVIVRRDLPIGLQVANVVHAAGESGPAPEGTIAVALHAEDAAHLEDLAEQLDELDIEHRLVVEGEGPYASQTMAIGVRPTADRDRVRRILSSLPLVK